jgi:16S rRNA (guanine527-N7)-methyltransferase
MTGGQSAGVGDVCALLAEAGMVPLTEGESASFAKYLELILQWNARTNLTSVRDREGILRRHFVECIACARSLPDGIRSVLDFGSGAGFPGIPVAICRPELEVTLAEAQNKKAAFLNEAVRTLGLGAKVFPGRADSIAARFDCVTLRAVDHMADAIAIAVGLLNPAGWLAVMTTVSNRAQVKDGSIEWNSAIEMPFSEQRILLLGNRSL